MKVLVINEYCSDNIGDQAISAGVVLGLEKVGYQVRKADYSGRKQESKLKKTSKNKKSIKEKIKERILSLTPDFAYYFLWMIGKKKYINSFCRGQEKVAIIGGGQLILSNRIFPIAFFLWTRLLHRNGIKIILLGIGVGEKFSLLDKFLYKKGMDKASKIYVRDQNSLKNLEAVFQVRGNICKDLAYLLREKVVELRVSQRNVPSACVAPTDYSVYKRYNEEMDKKLWSNEKEYFNFWCDKIKRIHATYEEVILISTTKKDYDYSFKIFNILKYELSNIKLVGYPLSYSDFCKDILDAELFVSGRMHGLILAHMSNAAKIIPVKVSKKISTYADEYLNSSPEVIEKEIIQAFDGFKVKDNENFNFHT